MPFVSVMAFGNTASQSECILLRKEMKWSIPKLIWITPVEIQIMGKAIRDEIKDSLWYLF